VRGFRDVRTLVAPRAYALTDNTNASALHGRMQLLQQRPQRLGFAWRLWPTARRTAFSYLHRLPARHSMAASLGIRDLLSARPRPRQPWQGSARRRADAGHRAQSSLVCLSPYSCRFRDQIVSDALRARSSTADERLQIGRRFARKPPPRAPPPSGHRRARRVPCRRHRRHRSHPPHCQRPPASHQSTTCTAHSTMLCPTALRGERPRTKGAYTPR